MFPEGTPGCALDTLARTPLWREGLNYRHGTGHGVGAALNVHEVRGEAGGGGGGDARASITAMVRATESGQRSMCTRWVREAGGGGSGGVGGTLRGGGERQGGGVRGVT